MPKESSGRFLFPLSRPVRLSRLSSFDVAVGSWWWPVGTTVLGRKNYVYDGKEEGVQIVQSQALVS
jgi:hypothetical protein